MLERAQNGEVELSVTSQILGEVYSIITNPRRVTNPYAPIEALDQIEKFLAMPGINLLSTPPDFVSRWISLARQRATTGGEICDVQHVAVMLGNGVKKIYTFNRADFEPFTDVQVLTP